MGGKWGAKWRKNGKRVLKIQKRKDLPGKLQEISQKILVKKG